MHVVLKHICDEEDSTFRLMCSKHSETFVYALHYNSTMRLDIFKRDTESFALLARTTCHVPACPSVSTVSRDLALNSTNTTL